MNAAPRRERLRLRTATALPARQPGRCCRPPGRAAAPASSAQPRLRAGRHAAGHDHHRRHAGHAEQPEQPGVDGHPGLRAADALPDDASRSRAARRFRYAAQHQRRADARRLMRAHWRQLSAGTERLAKTRMFGGIRPAAAASEPRMAFGREGGSGPVSQSGACPGPRSGDRLPRRSRRRGSRARSITVAGPFAERVPRRPRRLFSAPRRPVSRGIGLRVAGNRRLPVRPRGSDTKPPRAAPR